MGHFSELPSLLSEKLSSTFGTFLFAFSVSDSHSDSQSQELGSSKPLSLSLSSEEFESSLTILADFFGTTISDPSLSSDSLSVTL